MPSRLDWQPLIVLGQSTCVQELEELAASGPASPQVITEGDNCAIKKLFFHREMSSEMSIASENQFLFSLHNVSEKQNIRGSHFIAAHGVTVENPDKVGSR